MCIRDREPAFVGSTECSQCHESQFEGWLKSDHRNAMQPADSDNVLGNFDDVTVVFHGIENRLYRDDSGYKIDTVGASGKPETFDFLGLTHYCAKTRKNRRFIVGRKTQSKRMRIKLQQLGEELRRRMHRPVPETGQWLRRVVQGYYNYHSVPRNGAAMRAFTRALLKHWWKILRRRSHKSNCDWQRFYHRIARRWMPKLRVMHPYPEHRLIVTT